MMGQTDMSLQVAVPGKYALGESVFWCVTTQCVFWIDGFAPAIHSWSPSTGKRQTTAMRIGPVGMIVPTTQPGVVVLADRDGVALFDLEAGARTPLVDPERGREAIGYNDAKVDPTGRLWVGTYDASEVEPRGCLWLLESGFLPRLVESGLIVVNGPAFSPDGRSIYVSDSIGRRILAFDVREDGGLAGKRVLVQLTPEEGLPDGLTTDVEGAIWCAHWDGARVTRFSPQGERLAVIPIPAPRVTSVAFGGKDLDTLYVTTARYGLTAAQLNAYRDAGSLFFVKPGVGGIAAVPVSLPFRCG